MQPHSSVGLEGLGAAYRWIKIPTMIYPHVGLPSNICSPREFCAFFGVSDPTTQDSHTCSVRAIVCVHVANHILSTSRRIRSVNCRMVAFLYTFQSLPSPVSCLLTEDDEDEAATPPSLPTFIPTDGAGVTHELPDTVLVQVRLHYVNGRFQASYVTRVVSLHSSK